MPLGVEIIVLTCIVCCSRLIVIVAGRVRAVVGHRASPPPRFGSRYPSSLAPVFMGSKGAGRFQSL